VSGDEPSGHDAGSISACGSLKIVVSVRPGGRVVGRYVLGSEIASGGMATVHVGRLCGPIGFSRVVAIKRLHPHLAKDPEFVAMFVDEARVAVRIRHPNVVPTVDVVSSGDELFLVMEYVTGEALSRLVRAVRASGASFPAAVASAVISGALHGLHAAHEAKNERGEPLTVVHRDVSPQNILVGVDGVPRVFDFGVAKALGRLQNTYEGQTKGKLAYMSPEQARGLPVERTTDVYAAAVVLWELLTGRRLFQADDPQTLISQVLTRTAPPPSHVVPGIPRIADDVVLRGLARKQSDRFPTALEMAIALEEALPPVSARELGRWVEVTAADALRTRAGVVERIERGEDPASSDAYGSLIDGASAVVETADHAPVVETDTSRDPPRVADASQVSSLSVSSTGANPRHRSPRRWGLVAGTCLVGAGLLSFYAMVRDGRSPTTASSAQARPSESLPEPPSPALSVMGTASSMAGPVEAPAPAIASASSSSRTLPVRKSRPPRNRPPSCDNPFTVDSDGIRHPRPECLHLAPVPP
jgi:serine/threonine protein kinase